MLTSQRPHRSQNMRRDMIIMNESALKNCTVR